MANVTNLKRQKTLGAPPSLDEASDNLSAPETAPAPQPVPAEPPPVIIEAAAPVQRPAPRRAVDPEPPAGQGRTRRDGRSLRRTGRTLQLATRVSPEFDERLRAIAERQGMLIVEVLEQALDAYEAKSRR